MLAGRKRKQRLTLNPRGKIWMEDSNGFGHKMLAKMGWTHGKGLGANEDGIKEHIRVVYKNDSKGMGFNEKDQWTEHEKKFTSLLKHLENSSDTLNNFNQNVQNYSDGAARLSLEKKSQESRVRLHYHKFTRGKDVSRYSEKDLASIFGKTTLDTVDCVDDGVSPSGRVDMIKDEAENFIQKGSMFEYFKSRSPKFSTESESIKQIDGEDENTVKGKKSKIHSDENCEKEILKVPKKKLKKNQTVEKGISDAGFDPMFSNVIVDGQGLCVEVENGKVSEEKLEKKSKKKRAVGRGISNPSFNLISNESYIEDHVSNQIEFVEGNDPEITDANDKVLKTKSTRKRKREAGDGISNPGFDSSFDCSINESHELRQIQQHIDVNDAKNIQKEKLKKKTNRKRSTNEGLPNPGFDSILNNFSISETEESTTIGNTAKDVEIVNTIKIKHKKKIMSTFAIDNPTVESNKLITSDGQLEDIKSPPVSNPIQIEDDLVLNVAVLPVPAQRNEKQTRQSVVTPKRRKSVTFSSVTEERIIPSNYDNQMYSDIDILHRNELFDINTKVIRDGVREQNAQRRRKDDGFDNAGFTEGSKKVASMSTAIDVLQAEVENDMNEAKSAENGKIVGELGPCIDKHVRLENGLTRLSFKGVGFPKPQMRKRRTVDIIKAKKSNRH